MRVSQGAANGILTVFGLAALVTAAQGAQDPRVTFFHVRVLAGYESLAESGFPGMENEPMIMVVPQGGNRSAEAASMLKALFRLESVDLLHLETMVEVFSPEVSGAQPSFFDAGESGEFRVWWFGDTSSPLAGWLTVAFGVDFQGQELIPPLQVLCAPTEMVVAARRIGIGPETEELQSLAALKEPNLILLVVITAEQVVPNAGDFPSLVDRYLVLRGHQRPTGGTIPLKDDPGYGLLQQLFAQHFRSGNLDYEANKRVPVSLGPWRPEVTSYDTPPQLSKGNEAIRAALLRVFGPEDLARFAHSTVMALVNEKGIVEEVRISPMVGQEVRRRWLRALKLLRWKPATLHGDPVRAWAVLPIAEAIK